MNINLEKNSPVSGVITIELQKADYEDALVSSLKKTAQKANMPGFRPGHVPMSIIRKLYGPQAKMDAVNNILGDKLFGYIREEKINMLGEPLPHEGQEAQDIEGQDDFTFQFDIAIAPEFDIELTTKDKVEYYDIEVNDKAIDDQVEQMRRQNGHHEEAEAYAENDILRGILAELDENGQPKEGGLVVEKASLMPNFFKEKKQQKLFAKAKKNDVITFTPAKAYKDSDTELAALLRIKKEEAAAYKGDFSFQVDEISRFVPAELNQEFFDMLYGKDQVKTEEELRARVKEQLQHQLEADADYKFRLDLRAYCEKKVGDLEFPRTELRRIMIQNNKDKDEKYVDENFDRSIEELKWHLIREKLALKQGIKVEDKDIHAAAVDATRFQFAQYGMNNLPDEYIQQYVQEMLKNENQVNALVERCVEQKLTAALKNVVTLEHKGISIEDFQKLF
ncbi:MAG: trigger factor [Alloprevotella sp.]|nr:trigger factor [Alloprevotella sp.]MBR1653116.1 trigger factor [Alloprevotella sp.]